MKPDDLSRVVAKLERGNPEAVEDAVIAAWELHSGN
jgi:hypothetical protein